MSYLAIYRRFRPDTFDKMVGQEQVVRTLVNQIKTGRIGHAYLFCGARGTGKTTAARVFARAINCESTVDGSPCGKCETCRKLSDPQNLDIIEIDAASNNKVDNVREIRDKIQYPPVACKYKVYIIDEAHMLTAEAFNALLKTLEEPPKHAVIIMATTEPHKLPATILSRCMRFDFRLVPEKTIADLIKSIYDQLGKEYEDEAISEIARAGEGSFRDALSVADTCVSFSDGKLTYDDVVEVLGATDGEKVVNLVSAILKGDVGASLYETDRLISLGKSVSLLSKDLSVTLRNLLVIKTCDKAENVLSMAQSKFDSLKAVAKICDEHRIFRAEEIFAAVENDLKYSTNARVVFETAVVKAAMPQADYNIDALVSRIAKLEKALEDGAFLRNVAPEKDGGDQADRPIINQAEISYDKPLEKAGKSEGVANVTAPENIPTIEPVIMRETEKPTQTDHKAESTGITAATDSAVKPKFSDTRIWGVVLRQLRAEKNYMLWVACQEQEARTVGNRFCVFVEGENEYNTIIKPENADKIRAIISEMTPLELCVTRRGEISEKDDFENDIKKAEEILGKIDIRD